MNNIACQLSDENTQTAGDDAAQLRRFRNKFRRYYIKNGEELAKIDLVALLLLFALNHLTRNGIQKINGISENLQESKWLFELLLSVLPDNLRHVFPQPNDDSWQKAEFFYENIEEDFFADIGNLGFAFQIFSINTRKNRALPALHKADKKITKEELIAFTQLYTPSWVVDFLVANTVLPLVASKNTKQKYLKWLLPTDSLVRNDKDALADITILDPACGSGQFLLSAFELLFSLIGDASGILSNKIFAADIDERALWVAGLALLSKCLVLQNRPPERLNLILIRASDAQTEVNENQFLGSIDKRLEKKNSLNNKFKIILTNPPYIGRKYLSRSLKAALKEQYPKSAYDLAAAFLERCAQMLEPGGKLGIITQSSFLAIPSYKELRDHLLDNYQFNVAIHCGPGVFPLSSGEKIDSLLLVLTEAVESSTYENKASTFFANLSATKQKKECMVERLSDIKFDEPGSFIDQKNLKNTGALLSGFSVSFLERLKQFPLLGQIADVKQGLATTNNGRFVRYRFDVDDEAIGSIWKSYVKGAGAERYASEDLFVVKWGNDGSEIKDAVSQAYPYLKGKTAWVVKNESFYFRPGLCFSFINKNGLAVRRLSAGAIFDVASSAIFVKSENEDFLLAYLNSTFVGILAKAINQTINLQVGDVKKLPVCSFDSTVKMQLADLGKKAYQKKTELLNLKRIKNFIRLEQRISAEYLEGLFANYNEKIENVCRELNNLQGDIDKLIREGLKDLTILDDETAHLLIEQEKANFGSVQFPIDRKYFALKVIASLMAKTLAAKGSENIVNVSVDNANVFANLFNISDCGLRWLEICMGRTFAQLFCQTKLVNINKMIGEPAQYFSLWSKVNSTCTFFSAIAIRNMLKGNAKGTRLPELEALSFIDALALMPDWTSQNIVKLCSN